MLNYFAYTGNPSYNEVITQALLAQVGPDSNFMPPAYFYSLGNDDQAFWAIAALNAAEQGFPVPEGNSSTLWTNLAEAVFNTMVPRWYTTHCNGGLQWQVFQSNPGWGYKNSVSNGGFFQIAARLARLTGNQTYVDWSEKIWDWMTNVGFIDGSYDVFDVSVQLKLLTARLMLLIGSRVRYQLYRDRSSNLDLQVSSAV